MNFNWVTWNDLERFSWSYCSRLNLIPRSTGWSCNWSETYNRVTMWRHLYTRTASKFKQDPPRCSQPKGVEWLSHSSTSCLWLISVSAVFCSQCKFKYYRYVWVGVRESSKVVRLSSELLFSMSRPLKVWSVIYFTVVCWLVAIGSRTRICFMSFLRLQFKGTVLCL